MICFPNAKINLGLHVVNRREDGYHNLETIFYPVPLCDALEVTPATQTSFSQFGIPIDGSADDNLVMKALRALSATYDLPTVAIHLQKAIPFGAGLGGGSADAAFMLKLMNEYAGLGISNEELERMAAAIGADCPFFIRNTPVYATGLGEKMQPIELSLKDYYICIVKPDVAVSTKEAYAMLTPAAGEYNLAELAKLPVKEWKGKMVNHFEEPISKHFPVIAEIKKQLYGEGADYAAMTGSGSAVFGLFKEQRQLKDSFPAHYVWQGMLKY